jgi:hypothetical protein
VSLLVHQSILALGQVSFPTHRSLECDDRRWRGLISPSRHGVKRRVVSESAKPIIHPVLQTDPGRSLQSPHHPAGVLVWASCCRPSFHGSSKPRSPCVHALRHCTPSMRLEFGSAPGRCPRWPIGSPWHQEWRIGVGAGAPPAVKVFRSTATSTRLPPS